MSSDNNCSYKIKVIHTLNLVTLEPERKKAISEARNDQWHKMVKKATQMPAIAPDFDKLFFFNPLSAIKIGKIIATETKTLTWLRKVWLLSYPMGFNFNESLQLFDKFSWLKNISSNDYWLLLTNFHEWNEAYITVFCFDVGMWYFPWIDMLIT